MLCCDLLLSWLKCISEWPDKKSEFPFLFSYLGLRGLETSRSYEFHIWCVQLNFIYLVTKQRDVVFISYFILTMK